MRHCPRLSCPRPRGGAPIHLVRALGHASITHRRPLPPRPPQGQLRKISRIVNGQNLCRCCYEALQQRGLERSAISCAGWCRAKEGRGCGQQESPLSHHDSGVSLRPAELSRTRRVSALVDHQWGAASAHRQGLGKRVQFGGSSSSIFSSWLGAFSVPAGGRY